PYSVRVTSEIMESNGSSSMATVCGGSLTLMDAGIPIQRHVAGISIGLCTEFDDQENITQYKLLTDIIGWEDAFCDMDCKIAGSINGITGFQLDLKLKGIPHEIIDNALEKAKIARLQILDIMSKTIAQPRPEFSKHAPRVISVKINTEKIGLLIGPGGKNVKKIADDTGCEINIEDDGTVHIYGANAEAIEAAKQAVESFAAEPEVGRIYKGKVVSITDFGAFVEFLPGQDGLVHVSELAEHRVKNVEDVVKIGDEVIVKCLEIDDKNRVRLSRKAALLEKKEELLKQSAIAAKEQKNETTTPAQSEKTPEELTPSQEQANTPTEEQTLKDGDSEENIETENTDIEESEDSYQHQEDLEPQSSEKQRKHETRSHSQRQSHHRDQHRNERFDRRERGDRTKQRSQRTSSERQTSTDDAVVGQNYRGRVTSTKEYGAFIEFLPGKEGLCHISELANFRVKRTEDIVKVGDEITVKYLGVDEKGRVRLSRKAVIIEREQAERQEQE
ncbi:MAG: S1 RNA-binding domain-containing protein, partial [Verrucomicrobiae bacterium]|nr:S1 RNA-binding domain-containing protein [Verrucomicrobiae bacterium]